MPKDSIGKVADKSLKHAEKYLKLRNYGRAFAHYLVVLRLSSRTNTGLIEEDFVFSLGQWGQELEKTKKIKELFECYEQALEFFPANDILLGNFGAHLFRLGYLEEAAVYFQKAIRQAPTSAIARTYLDNISNALVERWHFGMLNCVKRNQAFKAAIERAISKGHNTVLDIGTGTSILSMFAVASGAKEVYACEMTPAMNKVAVETLKVNRMSDKVCLHQMASTDMKVPEQISKRVMLVITETFDCGLFGEHSLETLIHAWNHLLLMPHKLHNSQETSSVGGRVIPFGATVWACLIECNRIAQYSRWNANQAQLPTLFSSPVVIKLSDSEPYNSERLSEIRGGYKKLCQPVKILKINFNDPEELQKLADGQSFTHNVRCIEAGRLDAIAVWFDLHLDEIASISTCPESGTCWEQAIYPTVDPYIDEIVLDINSQVSLHVSYQSCLKVTHATTVNHGSTVKAESQVMRVSAALPSNQLLILNDHTYQNAVDKAIAKYSNSANILLSCSCPFFAANAALRLGIERIGCLQKNSESEQILRQATGWAVNTGRLTFETEDSLMIEGPVWNVLIIDVIEMCGTLKPEAIAEISILRECALQKPFSVIPSKVTCFACLIDSQTLLERNRVIDDDKTLGYQVSEVLNAYKVTQHQDLDLWTLPHTKLSDCQAVLTLDFMKEDTIDVQLPSNGRQTSFSFVKCKQETSFQAMDSGCVTAIAYWFEIHMVDGIIISTLNIDSHWNQAAIVLDTSVIISCGQTLTVVASCDNGHMALSLKQ